MSSFLRAWSRWGTVLFAAVAAGASAVLAQAPAPAAPGPGAPRPNIAGTSGFAPGIDPNENMGALQFSDMKLEDVLVYLQTLTGKTVLRPQALPAPQLTLNARGPLTRAEALVLIETLLSLNQIGITPLGDKSIKIVQINQVRQEAPELVVGSLRDQPPSGKVVSKLFRLQYLDTQTFQTQLSQFLSPYASVVPFATTNSVVVTDSVSNLQRLEYLVTEVDRRLNIETKFYQINYANAAELAEQIRRTLETARTSVTGGRAGGPGQVVVPGAGGSPVAVPLPGGQPAGGAGGGGGGVPLQVILSSNTAINADERTNQLIVITDPANLPFFDNIIERLDVPADPPTTIEVFVMNYANAEELAGVISNFIGGRSTGGTSSTRRTNDGVQRARSNIIGAPGGNQPTGPLGQPQAGNATALQRQQAAQGVIQNAVEVQGTQFSQFMTVVPDIRTNAIVVSGTDNDIGLVRKIIDSLDVVLAQVRIEVVIAEVTLTKNLVRGIDAFNFSYNDVTGETSVRLNPAGDGVAGPFGLIIEGITSGKSLQDITLEGVFSAARTNNNVNLLSVPTIVTTHNQEALISVGESRPIITSTQSGLNTGTTSSQVQYQDIPIQLEVTPVIGPNNVVQLKIDQQVKAVTSFVTIDGNQQPVVDSRQATSYLSVKDGQLVVLGGLQKNTTNQEKRRMFLFGEIPIIGDLLFTRTSDNVIRTDLLLFLRPTVLRNTDEADADARNSVRQLHPSKEDAKELERITGEKFLDESEKESHEPRRGPRP